MAKITQENSGRKARSRKLKKEDRGEKKLKTEKTAARNYDKAFGNGTKASAGHPLTESRQNKAMKGIYMKYVRRHEFFKFIQLNCSKCDFRIYLLVFISFGCSSEMMVE